MPDADASAKPITFDFAKNFTERLRSALRQNRETGYLISEREANVSKKKRDCLKEQANTPQNTAKQIPVTGWQRIKGIYTDGDVHAEKDITVKIGRGAFMVGAFVGGFLGTQRAAERYEMHSYGRKFLSFGDAMLRKSDYAVLVFLKNGFKTGLKSSMLVGSITFMTGHLAAWRDRFSAWYFPSISVPVFAIMTLPYGSLAMLEGIGLGMATGLTMTAITYLIARLNGKPIDETYKDLKCQYEANERAWKRRLAQVDEIMREHKLMFRGDAWKLLKQQEASGSLDSLEDTLEDDNDANVTPIKVDLESCHGLDNIGKAKKDRG